MSMYKNLTTVCAAAVLAFGLAACGGGDDEMAMDMPEPTPQEMCEADGGRYNADMTCTSAAELAVEMEQNSIAAAISMAKAAADALSAASSTEDVAAAEALITAAREAITGAEHATAAQTAVSLASLAAVSTTVATASTAVGERIAEEAATAARVEAQKMALMAAAGDIPSSVAADAASIVAANAAIAALEAAIAAAADVSDTSMYQSQVTAAKMAVATAQANLDTMGRMEVQRMALTTANTALQEALGMLDGTPTQGDVDAATTALGMLNAAIEAAADLADTSMYSLAAANASGQIDAAQRVVTAQMEADAQAEEERLAQEEQDRQDRMTAQRTALTTASTMLGTALTAMAETPTQATIDAAQDALDDLNEAIAGADDLEASDTEGHTLAATSAMRQIVTAQAVLTAANEAEEKERLAAMAAAGKALFAALAGPAATNTALDNNEAAPTLLATGAMPLTINAAAGAGSLPRCHRPGCRDAQDRRFRRIVG